MYGGFQNFERPQLLHLLVYRPGTCRDVSKWGYLHCVKILSEKSLIQIFDDVIAIGKDCKKEDLMGDMLFFSKGTRGLIFKDKYFQDMVD